MSNFAINFFVDTILLLCAVIVVGRMIYVTRNREAFLKRHKYKAGSPEYARVMELTSTRSRTVAAIAVPIIIGKTVFDIYNAWGEVSPMQIWSILSFVGVVAIAVAFAIYTISKE